jgi:competence/damage-inducible protein CinA-like protein
MPSAEIISIGTEILLGEIVDTNAQYIARALKEAGIDLFRKTTIGDNAARIALALREALDRSDIIITSGGLGPTVDDLTREGVAIAAGVEIEYMPELWEQIQERFRRFGRQPTDNNKRQAYVPAGAIPIENPVGTAPAFIVLGPDDKTIISLPGVPREMEYLMRNAVLPFLANHYSLHDVIKSLTLHTSGAGESQIDELIADLEKGSNPTVGLSAHAGQVDIRITAKADSLNQANAMIREIETSVRQRLGNWIYGVDEQTLQEVALDHLAALGWSLGLVEAGLNGKLTERLAAAEGPFVGGKVLTELPQPAQLQDLTNEFKVAQDVDVCIGVGLYPAGEKQDIHLILITPDHEKTLIRSYGGPPQLAQSWAVNITLDLIRKLEKGRK